MLGAVLGLGLVLVWQLWTRHDMIERLGPIKAKVRSDFGGVPQLSAEELRRRLEAEGVEAEQADDRGTVLLDVRRADEYAVSRLEGAIRVDPDATSLDGVELPVGTTKQTPIVVYCSVGYRSSRLAERLIEAGWENVENLEGSIFEWAALGHPLVDDQGAVEKVHPYGRPWSLMVDPELRAWEPR